MLKDREGRKLELRHPNPLMESQNRIWGEAETLQSFNLEKIGVFVEPPAKEGGANLEKIGEELVIRNQDGTPYKLEGNLKLFDPKNVDQDLMHSIDAECIQLSGSPVFYYRIYIDQSNYDDLYQESRNKVRKQQGIELIAHWEPVTPQNDLGVFGIDSPDEVVFSFNIREFKDKTGNDLPVVGSLIYTPFDKNWWEIIQIGHGKEGGDFQIWGKYRFQVLARKYQESITDEEPTRPEPNQAARDIIIR